LALTESVDAHTSLVLCDDPAPEQGKGYQACELGVPMLGSAEFTGLIALALFGCGVVTEDQ
ncbi:DNA polymerase III subunit epsilon, partial [Mycobacterium sp. ITM-2017-0098]